MNKLILILCTILILASCEKNNDSTILDGTINILYTDIIGNDLLDTNTQNYIHESEIDVYYLINGKTEKVYNPMAYMQEGFKIIRDNQKQFYYLMLGCNSPKENNITETYIKIGEDTDTIKCRFRIFDNGYAIDKVWYNNVEQTTKYGMDFVSDFIEITK